MSDDAAILVYFAWLAEGEDPKSYWKSLIQKVSKLSQRIMITTMNFPDSNKASLSQTIALVTALLNTARSGSFSTAFTWIIEWFRAWERNNWVFNCWERNNWGCSIVWERTDWMHIVLVVFAGRFLSTISVSVIVNWSVQIVLLLHDSIFFNFLLDL